jgi:phospholipid/cholesterol/gamma-HCH transport system ATP-binding protein
MNAMNDPSKTSEKVAENEGPLVRVSGLTVGWGDVVLAKDVSFEVGKGEVFGILGGSGCGKSTLLRFLVGLEIPTAGTIDIVGKGPPNLDNGMPPFGVMFQGGALFGSLTVAENVALPLEEWTSLPHAAATSIALAKLRLVGLGAAGDKLPSEISGGMKKRAAIARALAVDPPIVFLDEPSAGLDPITSAELDELILTLAHTIGLTVVLVTHELESIYRIVDQCIVLDKDAKGVIARGAPKELKESNDPRVRNFFQRKPRETEKSNAPREARVM